MTRDWRAVLLAGGRSSRMGTDKAMLPWGAGTLIAHMHALLLTAGARQVVVSGHRPEFDGVPDAQPGTGPMGALAQLAPQLQEGQWLVVPIDMPLLTVELVHALLSVDAACACVEDHPLPMALRLDAGVRAVLADIGAREGRVRSLRALHERLRATYVPAPPWREALRNGNTPEEWDALRTMR